jgi:hypothetical protein
MFLLLALIFPSSPGLSWGREGHQVVALIAEKYVTADAQAKAGDPGQTVNRTIRSDSVSAKVKGQAGMRRETG